MVKPTQKTNTKSESRETAEKSRSTPANDGAPRESPPPAAGSSPDPKSPTAGTIDGEENDEQARVVYRRVGSNDEEPATEIEGVRAHTREIAPAITPLIIGFTLLIVLISVLGYLSVRRMDDVSFSVLDLEHQYAAKMGLLLKLRLALTRLDNEARQRQEADARRELKPPFDFRLSTARDEMNKLLRDLERPPLSDDPTWRRFRGDLLAYVEVTEDLRRYSLEGFSKFRIVDAELDDLLRASGAEQDEVFRRSEIIEQQARASIRLWSVIALLVGALVAAGTIWEVQRRFRQMRRSMFEARRERIFTNQLLEGMVSAVAAVDENDRIRSANAAFFKIFPAASIGASVNEKFAPDDAMRLLEAAMASRADQATYRGRWVCRIGEEGVDKTLDVYSSPLRINGDRGQIVTLVDVTEAAESELVLRRTESLAAVGRATTQVAHEIRNPLGSIRLGVSMLRDSIDNKEGLKTIELVERGVNHLNKLVVDVTQFSRQKALELHDVDLHELLSASVDLVSDRIHEKEIDLKKIFNGHKIIGRWDVDQLRQVFVNIVANAIDASPQGGQITISTRLVRLDGDGNSASADVTSYARTTITDQGSGIDEASLQRIFEPFFSTKKRGTGLGLAIVRQIVEQHNGRISAESEPEKGTSFIIDLPL